MTGRRVQLAWLRFPMALIVTVTGIGWAATRTSVFLMLAAFFGTAALVGWLMAPLLDLRRRGVGAMAKHR